MHLYLSDSAVKAGISSGRVTIRSLPDKTMVRELPLETVEGI